MLLGFFIIVPQCVYGKNDCVLWRFFPCKMLFDYSSLYLDVFAVDEGHHVYSVAGWLIYFLLTLPDAAVAFSFVALSLDDDLRLEMNCVAIALI